ncbi:MAG: hypothetical protein ABWX96_13210 [Propionibacteriaceae bacterium]
MNGTPPTPETTVSTFVWFFAALVALTVVLTLMVIRRRHRTLVTLGVGAVCALTVAAGYLFLIIPPWAPSVSQPGVLTLCPYDRVVWSNMSSDIDPAWQPCRRVARLQLALTLMGVSALTVGTAVSATRISRPDDSEDSPAEGVVARR